MLLPPSISASTADIFVDSHSQSPAGRSSKDTSNWEIYLPVIRNGGENQTPYVPFDPDPADGANKQPINRLVAWLGGDPNEDSVTYDVYFEAGVEDPDVLVSQGKTSTSYDPGTLAYSTTYSWKIVAKDEHGASVEGPVWRFTTQSDPQFNQAPDSPSNPSPAQGASDQLRFVSLEWTGGDPDGDAVTYDVFLESSTSTPDVLVSEAQSERSFSAGPLAFSTTYYWKIVATDELGASKAGPVWHFTTQAAPQNNHLPETPANPSPSDGAIDLPTSLTLEWTGGDPDGDAVTYDVYFEAGNTDPDLLVSASQSELSFDPGLLDYSTTYYWKITATDEHGAFVKSPVWSFTTQAANQPPDAPGDPAPADAAVDQSIGALLSWSGGDPDGDAVTYDVYFEADNSDPALIAADQSGLSYDPGALAYSTTYYWKIVATDEHGASTEGPVWSFTTQTAPPEIPGNPDPADTASDQPIDAQLSWTGGDPDGDAVTYDVYFEAGNTPPGVLVSNDQSELSYDPGALDYSTTYYWKIVATDEHGASTEGPVWSFTTQAAPPENQPPTAPGDPLPADTASDQPVDAQLSWTGGDPDGDAVTYDVYFEAGNAPPVVLVSNDQSELSYDPGALDYSTTYYWKIVATDEHGASTEGPVWSFTTAAAPP